MLRLILIRIVLAIPTLIVVGTIAFALQAVAPGDPARLLLQAEGVFPITEEARAAKASALGLEDPVLTRYVDWLSGLARGDLGDSYQTGQPIVGLLLDRIGATSILAVTAMAIGLVVAVPLGLLTGLRDRSFPGKTIRLVAVIGVAMPGFWFAFLLMAVFSQRLGWFPVLGSVSPTGIIMPALTLGLPFSALLTRVIRGTVLDIRSSYFLDVARAKGLTEWQVLRGHLVPNVLPGTVTIVGLELAGWFAGAAITEQIFAWPGVGRLAIDAALARDLPVVNGVIVVSAAVVLVTGILLDTLHRQLDPRLQDVLA